MSPLSRISRLAARCADRREEFRVTNASRDGRPPYTYMVWVGAFGSFPGAEMKGKTPDLYAMAPSVDEAIAEAVGRLDAEVKDRER